MQSTLVNIYQFFIRQGLELAAPLWATSLTTANSMALDRVQAQATKVICYPLQLNADQRNKHLGLPNLKLRRDQLVKRCAIQMSKNEKFSFLFPRRAASKTRSFKPYVEPQCFTKRFSASSIATFISTLNNLSSADDQQRV